MRSIRYMFGGDCHNLEDCLHHSKKQPPNEVSVELSYKDDLVRSFRIRHLLCDYHWDFFDKKALYTVNYGALIFGSTPEELQQGLNNANNYLECDLNMIEKPVITVTNGGPDSMNSIYFGEDLSNTTI